MYTIAYKDGTIFNGGEPQNSLWNEIEQRSIKQLEYKLGNKTVILNGYEMYNHIVEYAHILQKGSGIITVAIMGLSGNLVTGVIFNLKKQRIETFRRILGKEWNGGMTLGWKPGILDGSPKYNIK